MKLIKINL